MRPLRRRTVTASLLLGFGLTAAAQDPCHEWTPGLFYRGNGVDGNVDALTVFDDGSGPQLWVSGPFSRAGDAPISALARWNGSSWSAPVVATSAESNAFAVFDDGRGPALYAGGYGVGRWNGSEWEFLGFGMNASRFRGFRRPDAPRRDSRRRRRQLGRRQRHERGDPHHAAVRLARAGETW
ncbi:MAG: hypothetical protein HYR85_26735 [Planctomycetes bacterium]|nr:hypothetical protein [Planctomycetota bacterium]MBI3844921.1 hypothetical protein [Planctomycetota bacterium]